MALQIDEDIKSQKVLWAIERTGWVIMLLFLLAALLGIFGHGLLSERIAGEMNSKFWIEYNRFERHASATQIRFHISPGENNNGLIQLIINRDFIKDINIKSFEPQPDKVEAANDSYHYTFNIQQSGEPVLILKYEPDGYGNLYLKVTYDNHNTLTLNQWTYP